jgi:hypothetical protein
MFNVLNIDSNIWAHPGEKNPFSVKHVYNFTTPSYRKT